MSFLSACVSLVPWSDGLAGQHGPFPFSYRVSKDEVVCMACFLEYKD